jgi:hypothetical protein
LPVGFGLTVKQVAYDRALPNFSFFYVSADMLCHTFIETNDADAI